MVEQETVFPVPISDEVTQWRILNKATLALSKTETSDDIIEIITSSLNELGFHVVAGEVDRAQANIKIKQLSFNPNDAEIYPHLIEVLPSLSNRTIPLHLFPFYEAVVRQGSVEFVTFRLQEIQDFIGSTFQGVFDTFQANKRSNLPLIVAPIYAEDAPSHLIFVTSEHVNVNDIPGVTAFANLASAIMEKHALLQHAEEQKRIAQTLQEVSKIVGSSLELDTVLALILEQLATVVQHDSSAVFLESNKTLKLEAGRGFDQSEPVLDIVVPTDTNVLYQELKREQKPIVINDVRQDPRYALWAGTSPIHSWIGVPLIWKNKTIGQISIDSFVKNAFTKEEGNLAFAFAQHVATAIQNARLFHQVTQTASELRALLESARDVASTFDTEEVIYLMANRIKQLMQANLAAVYLFQKEKQALLPVVCLDDTDEPLAQKIGEEVANQAITTKQGVILNQDSNTLAKQEQSAFMAVPFVVKDEAIGAVTMFRRGVAVFKQADLDLLTRFALQTGIAIENSRLYEQVERRLRREGLLNRLARRLSNKLSLEELAADIVQTAQTISEADRASLILVDSNNGETFPQYVYHASAPGESLPLDTLPGMVMQAIKQQDVLLTDDFAQESYAVPRWIDIDIKGAIAVPLTSGEKTLGVLGLFTVEQPFGYSSEIINTLEAVGRQAGVAIENAVLFQQVNEYANNLAEQVEARTAEIRSEKEKTEAILASAADAIIITSADGIIEYVNPAFTTLTGYSLEDVIDKNPNILKSNQTPSETYRHLWRTILGGNVWRGELKNKRKDNTLYDADLTIAPIFNQHNQIEKFVGIQRDISKMRELDRLKTEFLGTAAHELRSPLTTIRGYAELLLARGNFSKTEVEKFIGYIHEQSLHLTNLVSDLLDISKIESGAAFTISPELLNPQHIFLQKVEQWQARTSIHEIRLVEPATWPEINVDPTRLDQIISNLLSNAIKYAPDGGVITITVNSSSAHLRISVSDQGIGMTLDEQKRMFEKFWRADASSTAIEGTGLGMVIVKYIVESHGGKIWVSSRKGEGTTVSFTLPLSTGTAVVLIIEDEASILEVQERLLKMEGYQILTAKTGTQGLELAQTEYPDLIILDLMLPEMHGEEVLKHLKSDSKTQVIPVVVVSAKSGLVHIENAFALGAVDFLTKPFDIDEYLGRIKIALSKTK
jgi:PAS domain S-box-containing protein